MGIDAKQVSDSEQQIHIQTFREIIWERYKFFPSIATASIAAVAFFALNPAGLGFGAGVVVTVL